MILAGLEGGGTKMVAAIGDEKGRITDSISIPTEAPDVTMSKLIEYFKRYKPEAIGIASFGPIDLNKKSDTYGYITTTTKLAWRQYDILGTFKRELGIPAGFDTDVNGACLGEVTYGCMRGVENGMYITIGTGVGVGIYCNGSLVHGMLHPEAGHVIVKRHPKDNCKGNCYYHDDCLEGFAAGPALEKRAGRKAIDINADSEEWSIEGWYIAQAICSYILTVSPQKIVLGGGVMNQKQLFPIIRDYVKQLMGGYINTKEFNNLDDYIVPASLGGQQGIMGCMKLAYDAAGKSDE